MATGVCVLCGRTVSRVRELARHQATTRCERGWIALAPQLREQPDWDGWDGYSQTWDEGAREGWKINQLAAALEVILDARRSLEVA